MKQRKYLTRHEISQIVKATAEGTHRERDACLFTLCF